MSEHYPIVPVLEAGSVVGQLARTENGCFMAFAQTWRGKVMCGTFVSEADAREAITQVRALPAPPEPIAGMEIKP